MAHIAQQSHQGAISVLRHGCGVSAAEIIVENFKAVRSRISGCGNRLCKAKHIKVAFTGHIAEMARPIE